MSQSTNSSQAPTTIQRRVLISGYVQGVGYRYSCLHMAHRHSQLRGWVRNLDDGRVEACFQGPDYVVEAMIQWCRQGPARAEVTSVDVIREEVDGNLKGFDITD